MPPAVITLVLGGTRSGKSEVAESLAVGGLSGVTVTYVATGRATDADMAARIAAHRARRDRDPVGWSTIELEKGAELAATLQKLPGPALVDSLGTWVASFPELDPDLDGLCDTLRTRRDRGHRTVLVSEEVGLGVHAPTAVGRRFTDVLGTLNRAVADQADLVLLVVAGRVVPLPRWDPTGGRG
jgi:adenosyl cobinamide kinase/adenosyl cobinamide phosphate guanylyltransferase